MMNVTLPYIHQKEDYMIDLEGYNLAYIHRNHITERRLYDECYTTNLDLEGYNYQPE